MKLRHTTTACALALALPLSACTADTQQPEPTDRNITLTLAAPADAAGQALAHVYAAALEGQGFTVELSDAEDSAVNQLSAGSVDIALTTAPATLQLLPDSGSEDIVGSDGVLSTGEITSLVSALNEAQLGFTAQEPSAADTGEVLAISGAGAVTHSVESVSTLAAACAGVDIVNAVADLGPLRTTLSENECTDPQLTSVDSDALADALRASTDAVAVLSAADPMIIDEGFTQIEGSHELFDAAPYLTLIGPAVDDDAAKALNEVTGELSQDVLVSLNRMVSGADALEPLAAAQRWEWITQQ